MTTLPHIPILRMGESYRSLDTRDVVALGNGEAVATLSIGNAGLVRRDAGRMREAREALSGFSCEALIGLCAKAGELFLNETLPLGETTQSPEDYVDQLSLTSGLPHTLVRKNMAKIHDALTHMSDILKGLTRGMDPSVIDDRLGRVGGVEVSYYATTTALGCVLPSNSPGVNALWLPAIALKTPVVLRPGGEEPWTPWRVIQSMIAAGVPAEAFGFYPSDHDGASAVMDICGRSIIFGGADIAKKYAGDPRVEVHGPGWSKVVLGADEADHWEKHLDVIVDSITANSGRSCINASVVITPRHGRALAEALAERMAKLAPMPRDHADAGLSGIANAGVARWADGQITEGLKTPGAVDLTAVARGSEGRLIERDGITYLLPTLIYCESAGHPLAMKEFMFPYAAVIEMDQAELVDSLGPSLVVSAITRDTALIDDLLMSADIQRLNLGPMPTSSARWDQPHEGNLFELLYQRRAIQRVEAAEAWA